MATTSFTRSGTVVTSGAAANAALIPQKWSKDDYKWMYEVNPMKTYIGDSDNAIIQAKMDLAQSQGDKITFALRKILTGDGQTDDGTYSGNSEGMAFYNMDVVIHERGHSTSLAGNMTEQSAYAQLRPKGRSAIREWVANIQTRDIIDSMSGLGSTQLAGGNVTGVLAIDASSNAIATVNKVAPTKGTTAVRWFGGGQTTAGVLERVAADANIDSTSNNLFGTLVISEVKVMATQTVDNTGNVVSPIRPVMIGSEPWYLMFVSRQQLRDLRSETAWLQAQREANLRGLTNPIFSGAEGIWDGVIIKVTDTLHRRTGDGTGTDRKTFFDSSADACANGITVHRALFCGAQATALAWGKMPVWKEGFNDPPHNTKWVTHSDFIYGVKKTVFATGESSADVEFGSIIVDTAVSRV
jgi:N4-gp56 family major capsid protein